MNRSGVAESGTDVPPSAELRAMPDAKEGGQIRPESESALVVPAPAPAPAPSQSPAAQPDEIEVLLRKATGNEPAVWDKLMPLIYSELRRLATHMMASEPAGQTLQPTALVNEAFIKIMKQPGATWADKNHLVNAVAQVMRRIMIDRARRRKAIKHGGPRKRVDLDLDTNFSDVNLPMIDGFDPDDAELLDTELTKLEREQPRWAGVVRLRYFAGLNFEQIAEAMDLSERTVRGDWRFAKAWLLSRMNGEGEQTREGRVDEMRRGRQRKAGDADDAADGESDA
jgi:RNA polymerase sigma factor (TIGR02999 family)